MRTVGALMTDAPAVADPDDTLDVAAAGMNLAESRHLPVVRAGRVIGVISMRDLLAAQLPSTRTTAAERRKHLHELRVRQVMSTPPLTISPDETAADAARAMLQSGVSCLPVVTGVDLVGIITTTDLTQLAAELLREHAAELGESPTVSSLMTSHPTVVAPDDRLNLAELVMKHGHFHHLPVVHDGIVVGMLSDRDVLAALRSKLDEVPPAVRLWDKVTVRVGDVMTPSPEFVGPQACAASAAHLLVTRRFGALPVVVDGRLRGIVTERDYLRYLLDRLAPSVHAVS